MQTKQYGYVVCAFLLVLVLGWLDYLTGPELGFFVFYFIPLAWIGWYTNPSIVIFTVLFNALVWYVADNLSGNTYSNPTIGYWNAFIRFLAFLTISIVFQYIKKVLNRQKELICELSHALEEVKMLSGLLSICAWCKKIRNDQGNWERLEMYISDHSEAEFTHCICPECAKTVSKELKSKKENKWLRLTEDLKDD